MAGILSKLAAGMVALLVIGGVFVAAGGTAPYTVTVVLPAGNPNLIPDAPIYVDGFQAGKIESVRPEEGHAVVEISVDDDLAPCTPVPSCTCSGRPSSVSACSSSRTGRRPTPRSPAVAWSRATSRSRPRSPTCSPPSTSRPGSG